MRNVEELSAEQLAVILDRADVVETWLKAVRDHAKALLEAGESIPGWTLKPTRPVRKWTDERAVRQRLSGEGLTGFLVEELATPAQVEKLAKKQGIALDVSDLISATSSGVNVAREPAGAGANAQAEFDFAS